jgi:hypothetical protein
MDQTTNSVLNPDIDETVESKTLDIGDGRVRQDRGLGSRDLSGSRVLDGGSLSCGDSQAADEREEALLGEHFDR